MYSKRTVEYLLGSPPKLSDLRQLVEETQDLSADATFQIKTTSGQRDSTNYQIIIEAQSGL